jgi:hypothetical protein
LAIRWALHDRSQDAYRKILGGNAGRLYRFDLDALVPVATKIGPTVAEVHTPMEDTGYRAPAGFDYRRFEGGRPSSGWLRHDANLLERIVALALWRAILRPSRRCLPIYLARREVALFSQSGA